MRYSMKRVMALLLSLTMVLSTPLTVFAANDPLIDAYDLDGASGKTGTKTKTKTQTKTKTKTTTKSDTNTDTGSDTTTWPTPWEKDEDAEVILNNLLAIRVRASVDGGDSFEVDSSREIVVEQGQTTDLDAELIYAGNSTEAELLGKFVTWDLVGSADPEAKGIKLTANKGAETSVTTTKGTPMSEDELYVRVYVDLNGNGKMDTEDGEDTSFDPPRPTTDHEAATALYIPFNAIKYAEKIIWNPTSWTFFQKHTVNLQEYVVDADTNEALAKRDTIVWTSLNANAKVDKKGVVTIKKAGPILFKGVSVAKGATVEGDTSFTAAAGTAARKFTGKAVENAETPKPNKPTAIKIKLGETATIQADASSTTTDDLTWTAKKPAIVSVTAGMKEREDVNRGNGKENQQAFTATITGESVGKTTVTAKASNGKKVTFTVTVTAPLESMTVQEAGKTNEDVSVKTLYLGQSVPLEAVKNPAANNAKVKWALVNTNFAKAGTKEAGTKAAKIAKTDLFKLKGVKLSGKGVLTIAASTKIENFKPFAVVAYCFDKESSQNVFSALYVVNELKLSPVTSIQNITGTGDINAKKATVWSGQKYIGKANIAGTTDAGLTDELVTDLESWTSNKTKVAYIKEVQGFGEGTTGIVKSSAQTLTGAKGKTTVKVAVAGQQTKKGKTTAKLYTKTKAVTVKKAVTEIQLQKTIVGVKPGKTVGLKVKKLLPGGSATATYKWEAFDENGAPVPGAFRGNTTKKSVKFDAAGKTAGSVYTVRVTAVEGGATAEAKVYVNEPAKKVTLTQGTAKKLTVSPADYGKEIVLNVAISNSTTPGVEAVTSYSVNNSKVAKVEWDTEGETLKVTPLGAGTAKIKVMTPSGKSATFTLTVKNK